MMFLADAGWYSVHGDCLGSKVVVIIKLLAAAGGWSSVVGVGDGLDRVEGTVDMDRGEMVVCVSAFALEEVLAVLLLPGS